MNTSLLEVDPELGDAYLKFQLDRQTPAILSMEYAQEVVVIPGERITPIPNMPKCVLGLVNRHNKVLWVINLAEILDLQPLDTKGQNYHIVIIRVGQILLGLVVQEVKGITRFTPDCIQPQIGFATPRLAPYLNGCVFQQEEVLLLLNAEAIVHSPICTDE
jgi:twitching motility protein PilI